MEIGRPRSESCHACWNPRFLGPTTKPPTLRFPTFQRGQGDQPCPLTPPCEAHVSGPCEAPSTPMSAPRPRSRVCTWELLRYPETSQGHLSCGDDLPRRLREASGGPGRPWAGSEAQGTRCVLRWVFPFGFLTFPHALWERQSFYVQPFWEVLRGFLFRF